MFRFILLSAVVSLTLPANGYGYGSGLGLGYAGGYGLGGGLGGGYGGSVVPAAIISHHNVHHYDVPNKGYIHPTTIDVPANILPVNFIFRSASSLINVEHKHEGAKGSFKETSSQDEPHILKHTVTKPIIQEVNEIISPFRRITQTIEPVREEIQTNVARGISAGAGVGGLGGGLGRGGLGLGLGNGLEGGLGLGRGIGLGGRGLGLGLGSSLGTGLGGGLGYAGAGVGLTTLGDMALGGGGYGYGKKGGYY